MSTDTYALARELSAGNSSGISFGVASECGRLRAVLLHRPGDELSTLATCDPRHVLWRDVPDVIKARDQHDQLTELYRSHGVVVFYLDGETHSYPNLCFVRDSFALTTVGAILASPAFKVRSGEEKIAGRALERLGIPIRSRVNGGGFFEGADLMIVNWDLAFVATGSRTNGPGAAQVKAVLESEGIAEVIPCSLPRSCMHLDCALSIVDRHLAAVCADRVPAACVRALLRHGFRIVPVPPGPEITAGMAINLIAIEPGFVVLAANNPRSRLALSRAGAECLEVDISELLKGRGGVHCLTAPLWREEI